MRVNAPEAKSRSYRRVGYQTNIPPTPSPGHGLSCHAPSHGQHSPPHSYSPSPPHPSTSQSVPVVSNEPSGMQLASFGRGEWPMVELTACFHEEAISVQFQDVHLALQFQEWGVFAVKHTTAKKRGHLKDKNGNPVGWAWHYTFLLKEVDCAVPFMNQVIDSNLFMKENLRIGAYTMKSGLASFHAVKDLLYVDESFASAASPQEHQILLDMAPPLLHQASKGVELLNYGEFPPLQAPPLQGPLWSCELTHYTFMMALLSTKVALLPETPHIRQWHHFELICWAITAYKDYVMALHQGAQYHFMEDIWPVGGGKMNAIIRWLAAWCEEMPTVTRHPQYQEKEQIVFTKKGEWWLIIDSAWVIGEFGLPSNL